MSEAFPLVSVARPQLAKEITRCLVEAAELELAAQIPALRVGDSCGCGDGFCQSFYTAERPIHDGEPRGGTARTLCLAATDAMVNLDVVDGVIEYVEVIA